MKKERLGIVMLHHRIDHVMLNNLRSVQVHNPDATIITISASEPLLGGYTLEATPELKRLHALDIKHSGDRLLCSWFMQRKEMCDKWWVIDWDVFCGISVRKYYEPVWHFPFVASSVCLPYRNPGWTWFKYVKSLPVGYQKFALGAVPCLYLLSENALSATCAKLLEENIIIGNSELRFATAANRCGFPPCGYSPPNDQITWMNWKSLARRQTISHPIKHYVEF
jgi:hypothetical protein